MGKTKTFVICSDLHGDLQDKPAVKAFHKFLGEFNPDIRIFAGDAWDFACLRGGAKETEDERGRSLQEDWIAGEEFLTKYFSGGKEKVMMAGNHDLKRIMALTRMQDARLKDYGYHMLNDYDSLFKSLGAASYPYCKRKGVYRLGEYNVLHGYAAGIYSARKHAMSYGNCFFGHTHAKVEFSNETLETTRAVNIGCLCQLDHEYNATHLTTLRQEHSWAYGVLFANGKLIYNLAHEIEEGKFAISEGFKLVG